MKPLLAAAVLLAAGLAGCAAPAIPNNGPAQVQFDLQLADAAHTPFGSFTVQMDPQDTPKTAANFLGYVDSGYYVGLTFHRVVPGFVVQGGGYEADYKTRHTAQPPIPLEATASKPNKQWTLSMARTGDPNSATSEFFINLQDNPNLDATGPGTGYAVFGHVIAGQDTITKMTTVTPGDSFGAGGWYPKVPIVITAAHRVGGPSPSATPSATDTSTTQAPPSACPSEPNQALAAPGPVETDFMTPGVWNVCAATDYAYVWVHNNGTGPLDYTFAVTGPAGAALPSGWSVSFLKASGHIADTGAKDSAWQATLATVTVPAGQADGNVSAELHAGGATRAFTFDVHGRGTVAAPGQHANTQYTLRYPDGRIVQPGGQGPFCVDLAGPDGPGNAVPGYGWGVIGTAPGETITLVVPPPFGYHYGGQFGNDTMYWATTVTDLPSSC